MHENKSFSKWWIGSVRTCNVRSIQTLFSAYGQNDIEWDASQKKNNALSLWFKAGNVPTEQL